jgi:hypothetical protein
MGDERTRILNMLKEGKITVDEAEELLSALEGQGGGKELSALSPDSAKKLKYFHVIVEPESGNGKKDRVNIKIPIAIIRAGVKMTNLLPEDARDKINGAFREKGLGMTLDDIKEENIEDFIEALRDMTIDVEADNKRVKIFCE